MKAQEKNFFEGLFDDVRQAAESNLRLQQEIVCGMDAVLARICWPAARIHSDRLHSVRQQWSNAILQGAEAQRNLFDRQFDAALAVLDTALKTPVLPLPAPPPSARGGSSTGGETPRRGANGTTGA